MKRSLKSICFDAADVAFLSFTKSNGQPFKSGETLNPVESSRFERHLITAATEYVRTHADRADFTVTAILIDEEEKIAWNFLFTDARFTPLHKFPEGTSRIDTDGDGK